MNAKRTQRRRLGVYELAKKNTNGKPSTHCKLCRRLLRDETSQRRGMGPACWEKYLGLLESVRILQEGVNHGR